MAVHDDTRQSTELRQAFLRYLPQRLETLARRTNQLATNGWDINALSQLLHEIQTLTGACSRYGLLDLGEHLFALESRLTDFVEHIAVPDATESATLGALIDAIATLGAALAPPSAALPAIDAADRSNNGYPLQLTPPIGFVERFATATTTTPISSDHPRGSSHSPELEIAVSPASVSIPSLSAPSSDRVRRRAYHLSDTNAFTRELDRKLERDGWALSLIHSVEELRQMIDALSPQLVLVGARFLDDIATIGEIVRTARILANHRITLLVLSEASDLAARLQAIRSGADAFIALPMTSTEALTRVSELTDPESLDPFRVLIVEGNHSQPLLTESILREAGMRTVTTTEPLIALEELERFRPDLVLMDFHMSGCSGVELATIIRESDVFLSIPIVFLSDEQSSEKHFAALSAGGDDFLSKPVLPKHLTSVVISRARRARQIARRVQNRNPRDAATGLYDRAYLLDRINAKLADEMTHPSGGIMLAMLDATQNLREQLGLIGFEALLDRIGTHLADHVGINPFVARFGDGAFLVLDHDKDAHQLAHGTIALREYFDRETFDVDGQKLHIDMHFGICSFAAEHGDASAMLIAAEHALLEARRNGGHHAHIHHSQHHKNVALRETIAAALHEDGFQLVFQPIVSLQGGEEEQFQALLRLPSGNGRLHTAAEIVPVAEQTGMIDEIDRWVLTHCLHVLSERARQGRPIRLFANQSAHVVRDENRVEWLRHQLDTRKLASNALVLEVRLDLHADEETFDAFVDFVTRLKRLGVLIALGGIDASIASFAAVDRIPLDFVRLLPQAATQHHDELRRIVSHAHERGHRVIASGIEDASSAARLWTAGVDFIQGNFVQRARQDLSYDFRSMAS